VIVSDDAGQFPPLSRGRPARQGSTSQEAQRFHTYPNSSPPSAARPDRHDFCPSYHFASQPIVFPQADMSVCHYMRVWLAGGGVGGSRSAMPSARRAGGDGALGGAVAEVDIDDADGFEGSQSFGGGEVETRFVLAQYHQGQTTAPRLVTLLRTLGILISILLRVNRGARNAWVIGRDRSYTVAIPAKWFWSMFRQPIRSQSLFLLPAPARVAAQPTTRAGASLTLSTHIGRAGSRDFRLIGTRWTGAARCKRFHAANVAQKIFVW
jgi:hypothetical protein